MSKLKAHNQEGFSIMEMMIAITVMIVVTSGVFALMKGSMTISTATYEMTDAQENLRVAQEYINRDLMNAGDGLKSISTIRVPSAFVTSYLTRTPVNDPLDNMPAGIVNLGILTSDNNVPAGTAVVGSVPAANVRSDPGPDGVNGTADDVLTDRQTILEIDPDPSFPAIALAITPTHAIDSTGTLITISVADINKFTVGEIYYFSSSLGGTFATVTAINAGTNTLTFANGGAADVYGLNLAGTSNNIKIISNSGALATSLQRMLIIHYYVNSNGFLMRRVFGVKGVGFRDSIIAEHVVNVQFNYSLETTDANGNVVQPTAMLSNKAQRLGVRQVEVTVSVETPHVLQNGLRSTLSMTTSTSVRNMQFRQAVQPTAGG